MFVSRHPKLVSIDSFYQVSPCDELRLSGYVVSYFNY